MFTLSITSDLLSYLLAGLLAVIFDWFPGLSGWFATLSAIKKQQLIGALLLVIVGVIFALGCSGVLGGLTCDKAQVAELVKIYLVAIGINQGVHTLSKPTAAG